MADVDTKDEKVELTPEQLEQAAFRDFLRAVPANAAAVKFPTDKWGSLTGLKKEGMKAASAVRGQPDKQKALIQTLHTLLRHAQVRFDADAEARISDYNRIKERELDRQFRERTTGTLPGSVAEQTL